MRLPAACERYTVIGLTALSCALLVFILIARSASSAAPHAELAPADESAKGGRLSAVRSRPHIVRVDNISQLCAPLVDAARVEWAEAAPAPCAAAPAAAHVAAGASVPAAATSAAAAAAAAAPAAQPPSPGAQSQPQQQQPASTAQSPPVLMFPVEPDLDLPKLPPRRPPAWDWSKVRAWFIPMGDTSDFQQQDRHTSLPVALS